MPIKLKYFNAHNKTSNSCAVITELITSLLPLQPASAINQLPL